jgi:hypothetical protein
MSLFFSMALPAHSGPRPLIQFRDHFYTDGMTPWSSDQPVARPLSKHRTTQTQNKRIHTEHPCLERDSIPWSQRPSKRRQFIPQTARLLWPACFKSYAKILTLLKSYCLCPSMFALGNVHLWYRNAFQHSGSNRYDRTSTKSNCAISTHCTWSIDSITGAL